MINSNEILINADDFGLSKEVNNAIVYCFQKKLIDRTTLLVNMPFTCEAVEMSKKNNFSNKVGLHLNLVEGLPLTEDIKDTPLCDSNGLFNGGLFFNKIKNKLFIVNKIKLAIKKEIEAQIKRFINFGFDIKHIDSHMHSHNNLSVLLILLDLCYKYGFTSIRLARNIPRNQLSYTKILYKEIINIIIKKYNKKHNVEYLYFGGQDDITYILQNDIIIFNKKQNKYIELMIHPEMINGQLKDAYNKEGIEYWKKEYIIY